MEIFRSIKAKITDTSYAKTLTALGAVGAATAIAVQGVSAAPVLANDTFEGLPAIGEDVGGFMTGIVPGLSAFLLVMALVGGLALIFAGIGKVIARKIG